MMGRKRQHKNRHLPPRMHQKGKSFYLVVWDGTRSKWQKIGSTYAEAMIEYVKLERLGDRPQKSQKFKDLVAEYKLNEMPKLADSTQASYNLALVSVLNSFGEADVDQIQPAHIGRYMDLRTSKHSANKEKAVMSRIFKMGIRWGWCTDNPARLIDYHPVSRRRRIITKSEWNKVQLAAGNDLVPVLMDLLYLTGLRIGDVLKLRFDDVTEDGILVRQSKNSVEGVYELTNAMSDVIERARGLHVKPDVTKLIRPGTTIIHTRRHKPYSYYGIRSIFRRVVDRAGIEDFHIHDIRRTAITNAKKEGRRAQEFSLHRTEKEANAYVVEVPRVRPLEPMG